MNTSTNTEIELCCFDEMASPNRSCTMRTNVISGTLLKQLRSVVSLQSYDNIVQQGSMNLLDQQQKIYDIFHGNVEINMISQLERVINGRDSYANIYQIENRPIETDKETQPPSSSMGVINPGSEMLIIISLIESTLYYHSIFVTIKNLTLRC